MMTIPTEPDRYDPGRTTVVEHRTGNNSWIAALTVAVVILVIIVLGNLVSGNNDAATEPTQTSVDITTITTDTGS
jgi:hypothetical protein